MRHEFFDKPEYGMIEFTFERAGEELIVESGAMVARDTAVQMKTQMRGGLMAAVRRRVAGESIFLNTFTATGPDQRLLVAPSPEGDIERMELSKGRELIIQSGSYVCSDPTIELDMKWGGFRGFMSGEGLFFLKASGSGQLFVNSYGGIHPIQLDGSAPYILDTSHIVAFESTLSFNIRKIGGLKSLFFSGEGFVCEFNGAGTLWAQTRNPGALASFLYPFRPTKSN